MRFTSNDVLLWEAGVGCNICLSFAVVGQTFMEFVFKLINLVTTLALAQVTNDHANAYSQLWNEAMSNILIVCLADTLTQYLTLIDPKLTHMP